jgi:hypothetical protein
MEASLRQEPDRTKVSASDEISLTSTSRKIPEMPIPCFKVQRRVAAMQARFVLGEGIIE